MTSITTKPDSSQPAAETAVYLFDDWFDPIEAGVRDRVAGTRLSGEHDMASLHSRRATITEHIRCLYTSS